MNDSILKKALKFDPLSEAEKVTGKSYKDDKETSCLGFLLLHSNSDKKNSLLKKADDSSLSNDLKNYQRIITEEGFVKVLEIPFISDYDNRPETMFVYFNYELGILLCFDTYETDRVNGGKFYYNWIPNSNTKFTAGITSSGGYYGDGIWVGDHDCREAIRFHIRQLKNNGKFLPKWQFRPFIWLLHFMDTRTESYDYKKINQERISMLPQEVQDAIKGDS